MSRMSSLQDPFLNALRTGNNRGGEKKPIHVSVYLVNGIKLQGHVEAFDQVSIVLNNNGINQMVYRHAISTIVPAKRVSLYFKSNETQNSNESQEESTTEDLIDSDESISPAPHE